MGKLLQQESATRMRLRFPLLFAFGAVIAIYGLNMIHRGVMTVIEVHGSKATRRPLSGSKEKFSKWAGGKAEGEVREGE
jgi:hypothetical protein